MNCNPLRPTGPSTPPTNTGALRFRLGNNANAKAAWSHRTDLPSNPNASRIQRRTEVGGTPCRFHTGIFALLLLAAAQITPTRAQAPSFRQLGASVQRPQRSFLHLYTTATVPDGGVLHAGGNRGAAFSQRIPGIYRGSAQAAGGLSISATIISQQEIDDALTAEGNRLHSIRAAHDPNGSASIQQAADFLSRHTARLHD